MKTTMKLGILFAIIWILAKLGIYYGFQSPETFSVQPTGLLNILLLLSAISFGLYFIMRKETEESNFLNDVKNGMSAGLPYTMIVSVFIYLFYGQIAPEVNQHKINERTVALKKALDNPEELQRIKAENKDAEVMTRDEIEKTDIENFKMVISPGANMVMTMAGLLILSLIYSLLVTVILRRVVFRS